MGSHSFGSASYSEKLEILTGGNKMNPKIKSLDPALLKRNVEARAAEDIALCNIAGASVLVKQSGEIKYKKHFGIASLDGRAAVDDRTLFRLASMTKPITAVAALILSDRGLLDLEAPIEKYLPEFSELFVVEDGKKVIVSEKISVNHILTHTSGIGSGDVWNDSCKSITDSDKQSVSDFVSFISKQPLSFIPGTKAEYSGVAAFSVLTAIIEKLTGKTLGQFMKEEIFDKCDMRDTTFEPSDEQLSRMIFAHDKKDGKNAEAETVQGCVFGDYPCCNHLGGAGLVSTLKDYTNFADMLLARGVYNGNRIISEKAFLKMSTPQISEQVKLGDYRWGLSVRVITGEGYGRLPVGAFGWSGAYGTHFWVDPANEIIAIYLKNSHHDGGSGAVTSANFERDVSASFIN